MQNQILLNTTEIEKLSKRIFQTVKTKPVKYFIISHLPLYRLINHTRIPFHRQTGRDFCVIDIELNQEKDSGEELGKDEEKSEGSNQRSEVREQMSGEKEEEPP